MKKAYLLLADGTLFEGRLIGAPGTAVGETVFNTGMTGYQEILTDPSYYGQIVTQTYPLIGNYGVNNTDPESRKSWVRGYIVREICDSPSNFRSEGCLNTFLEQQNITGICGIDTRRLTRIIREQGVMNGAITDEDGIKNKDALLEKIKGYSIVGAVAAVTTPEKFTVNKGGRLKVALMDFGLKKNIIRSLEKRGCEVTCYPALTNPAEIISSSPDGIMLTNGPGDPAENTEIIENLKPLLKSGIPLFGICLGHQLAALASGGRTEKLKYGHRGANHPVKDLKQDRTFITSQNHGYAVVDGSLDPKVAVVSHKSMNDDTVEGVKYLGAPVFTVQFHPEASPGPMDTGYLFDDFVTLMEKGGSHNA